MSKKITKAVILAAGYGTRFLPFTKSVPKEMIPIIDKPIIQIIVEELVDAGITEIVMVVSKHKQAIKDHFSPFPELEATLERDGKKEELAKITELNNLAKIEYVLQERPGGTGHAILCAKEKIKDQSFVMVFGDDYIQAKPGRTSQMLKYHDKYPGVVMSGYRTTKEADTHKYGYAKGEEVEQGVIKIDEFIEKPGPNNLPSDMAIVSSYIFPPEIIPALEELQKTIPEGKELQYVDAVNKIKDQVPAYGVDIKNSRFHDCGNSYDYLMSCLDFASDRPELKDKLIKYLKELANK